MQHSNVRYPVLRGAALGCAVVIAAFGLRAALAAAAQPATPAAGATPAAASTQGPPSAQPAPPSETSQATAAPTGASPRSTASASGTAAPAGASAPAGSPSNGELLAERQAFEAAMTRVRLNLPDLPDPPVLENYVIYDYLRAARLRRDLALHPDDGTDAAIDAFLTAHGNQPVSRALRREWLTSLGARRDWDRFLPRSAEVTDPVLVCDRLAGRLATGSTDGLAAAALLRWLQPQKPPAECLEVFAWLRGQNALTPALSEQRARAALAADNPRQAREAAADAPAARQAALLQWAYLLEAPKPALTVLAAHPAMPAEPEALDAGFDKLTHSDPQSAWSLLPALLARPDTTPDSQAHMRRAAALGLAYDRDPRALAAFEQIPAAVVDPQVEEWRVRAALWAGDPARALHWIEYMPPTLAMQPRWRYWRARSLAGTGAAEAAAGIYADLADLRDYYGYLAADRLNRGYQLHDKASLDDAEIQSRMARQPAAARARELFECDQIDDAQAEWSQAFGGADAAAKLQAAHLASRWAWYAEAIVMLAQAGVWDDIRLRYPRPYPELVASAARLANLSEDWIYGVMRQESLYRKDAVSRADARGLMQMMPSTAAQVARRWSLPAPGRDGLFDPAIAIPLGAAHLREMLDRQTDEVALTLASYNAGANAVAHWMPDHPIDADVWIENIPFNETRGYVEHVLEHFVAFAYVRGAEPPRLEKLLPPVAPRT